MEKKLEEEVVDVLKNSNDIDFEHIQDEELSPLNQAVIEKEIAGVPQKKDWNIWKPERPDIGTMQQSDKKMANRMEQAHRHIQEEIPLDAPEQEIGEDTQEDPVSDDQQKAADQQKEEVFELPTDAAKKAADTILGMANNVLAVGGGFFVKIRKHKEFYEFDEIPELIDAQNKKNVNRIKLDKEDKALLKPPLVQVLKKKAKHLTPEQQLMGAALSIVVKKAQDVIEIKAENELLVERILDIVREEKGYSDQDLEPEEEDRDIQDMAYEDINGKPEPKKEKDQEIVDPVIVEEYDEEPRMESTIVEVAGDSETEGIEGS